MYRRTLIQFSQGCLASIRVKVRIRQSSWFTSIFVCDRRIKSAPGEFNGLLTYKVIDSELLVQPLLCRNLCTCSVSTCLSEPPSDVLYFPHQILIFNISDSHFGRSQLFTGNNDRRYSYFLVAIGYWFYPSPDGVVFTATV